MQICFYININDNNYVMQRARPQPFFCRLWHSYSYIYTEGGCAIGSVKVWNTKKKLFFLCSNMRVSKTSTPKFIHTFFSSIYNKNNYIVQFINGGDTLKFALMEKK